MGYMMLKLAYRTHVINLKGLNRKNYRTNLINIIALRIYLLYYYDYSQGR